MLAAVPLFFAGAADRLELLGMKCLQVLGGFVVGYVVGLLAGRGFDRWVYRAKTPAGLKKTAGVVCGLVLAVLVALYVFTFGDGGGSGGGTGPGEGQATTGAGGKKDDPTAPATKPPEKAPPKVDAVKPPDPKPDDVLIRVTFLGGADVVGDKFYQLDDQRLTFDELKAAVSKQKAEAGTRKVFLIAQYPEKNRIADDSVNVTQVTDWAKYTLGVDVLTPGKR